MKVLFLTPRFPYPPRGGGLQKTWAMVELLRQHVDLWLFCFHQGQQDEQWASAWGKRLRMLPLSRGRNPLNFLASLIHGLPLSVYRNHSQAMARLVREAIGEGFEAVIADHLYMAHYVPPDFPGRRILHLHNVESLMWESHARLMGVVGTLMRWEAGRLRRHELALFPRFHRLLVVCEEEGKAVESLGVPGERVMVVPNVALPDLLRRPPLSPSQGMTVAFLGTLSWPPNEAGLRWFISQCFPILRRLSPGVRLVVGGHNPPPWLRRAARRGEVELLAPLGQEDEERIYQRARALVEPAWGGGGTRVKVLNALARGLPVVTTPRGVRGLDLKPGVHVLVAHSPHEMAVALSRLMVDDQLWRQLSQGGREVVGRLYVPEVALRPLLEALT
jgi:polysaccharide biosynthesis protein PslH